MTAIRLEMFYGLQPRTSPRLLQPNAATTAANTNLLSGEIRGFHAPRQAKDLTAESNSILRAYRIPGSPDKWLSYASRDVDIIRSPIINDTHDRYYVFGSSAGRPVYNTKARIDASLPFRFLGVPAPSPAPAVTESVGTSVTSAYVYTFVTAYGEESPPSPATIRTGAYQNVSSWSIALPTTAPDTPADRDITTKRLYRTVPGQSSSLFFKVADIPLATTPYVDAFSDATVVLNPVLESTTWTEPDVTMEGAVVMPNGFLVGWSGRRVMLSEPYRPHAWPVQYELATEYDIVGMGVWNDLLVIGTESQPYVGQGISPASFTLRKSDVVEPCMSRRGVVPSSVGVYYPSPNGLMLVGGSGEPTLVTKDIVTKDEWLSRYTPANLFATQYGIQYIAFVSPSLGFIFTPAEQGQKLVEIDRFQNVEGIETDKYTGQVYLLYQDRVWNWDPIDVERLYWTWKSKEFHLPKPVNFGAAKIKFMVGDVDVSEDTTAYYQPFNTARFGPSSDAAVPDRPWNLNTLNGGNVRVTTAVDPITLLPLQMTRGHTLNGIQGEKLVASWTEPDNRMPLGGSLLYQIAQVNSQTLGVVFRAYANKELVYENTITDENMIRLPVGFKRDVWQFEMVSNSDVYSLQVAENGKELEKV